MEQALDDLRVLDLTHYIAGPFCTKLLADYGADVIKIEKPSQGDPARSLGPFPGDDSDLEASGLFLYLNTNKKSITLDLKTRPGVETFKDLVKDADVVVENFKPHVMPSFGLSYATLEKINSRLVMTSISNFGQTGPYRDFKAMEICLSAISGIMYLIGPYDRAPVRHGFSQMQFMAGYCGALATMTAIWFARKTSVGQHVDVSIMETVTGVTHCHIGANYGAMGLVSGREPRVPQLNYSLFPCKDGHINPVFMATIRASWNDFVLGIGIPALDNEKFQTPHGRNVNMHDLTALITEGLKAKSKKEIFESAQALRLPFSMVQDSKDLLECPQLASREFFIEIHHPKTGKIKYPGAPFKMSETPCQIRNRAPLLGEHNEKIHVGYTNQDKSPANQPLGRQDKVKGRRSGETSKLPLDGTRILDWSAYLAVPIATGLLADMGAQVIHMESCSYSDGNRIEGVLDNRPQPGFWNHGAAFNSVNRNKLGITLELRRPEGRELFLELVKISDVVAENWSPRVTHNLALDYTNLKKVKPDIIMLSSSGYGHTGPYRDYVSVGFNTEPMSGLSSVTGYPGRPARCRPAWPDDIVGVTAAFAILVALHYRQLTGKGQWIDQSQYETMVATLPEMVMEYVINGRIPKGIGNRDALIAPHGCYRCRGDDNWVVIGVCNDDEWHSLCQVMGKSSLVADSRFSDVARRQKNQDELDSIIDAWTVDKDKYDVMYKLQVAGVSAAPVLKNKELFLDPHLKARGFYKPVTHTTEWEGHKVIRPYPEVIWRMSKTPGGVRFGAPALGQNNEYVLRELLGKSEYEINELRREGIIGETPFGYEVGHPLPLTSWLENGSIRGYDQNYLEILGEVLGMELC
jgi:crotonobetainyl-CoA:carnitine CoA-transferase CaiB-like acyl-CoA transferase